MRIFLSRLLLCLVFAALPARGFATETPEKGLLGEVLGEIQRVLDDLRSDPRRNAVLAELYLKLAQIYQHRGRYDAAIAADRKAARLDPRNYVSRMHLISLYLDRQQFEAALGELEQARLSFATPVQYHLRRAEILHALRRYAEALNELEQAVQLSPHDHRVRIEFARYHQARGQKHLAQGYLEAAHNEAKGDPQALTDVAAAYRDLGWPDVAEKILDEIRTLRPQDYRPYRHLGSLYRERGDMERSAGAYLQALQRAPYLAEVHRELAEVYSQMKKDDPALRHYREAITWDADDPQNFLALASFYRQRERNGEALEQIRAAIRLDPASPIPYRYLGDYHRELGNFPAAAEAYREAVARDPGNGDIVAHLGWLTLFLGHFTASEALLRQAMTLNPQLQRPRHTLASAVFFQGRVQEALAMLDRFLQATPDAVELRSLRAYILYTLDRINETYEEARRIVQIQPANPEYVLGLAEVSQDLGQGAQAESLLRRVLAGMADVPPRIQSDPDLYLYRARAQAGLGQYDEAMANLNKALELNRNPLSTVNLYRNRGYVLFLRGDSEPAIQAFRQGLQQSRPPFEPEYWETRFALAYILLQLGKLPEAEAEFRAYLGQFPSSVSAHAHLAESLFAGDRFDEASQWLEKARLINPDSSTVHATLGSLLYRQGRYEESAEKFRRALAIVPRHFGAHVGLGFCLLELGRHAQAEWEFSQAIAVDVLQREPLARMGMAFLRFIQGEPDKARRMYEEALAVSPPFRDRSYAVRFMQLWMPAKGKAAAAWRGLLGLRTTV